MTHVFGHVECGGAGALIGDKQITIKDHTVLNIAVHLKHQALVDLYGATPEEAIAIGEMIEKDAEKWKKKLKKKFGVPYYGYEPNPANLG